MNIIIVEQLRKANEESKFILQNNSETSLKRREQISSYKEEKKEQIKNESLISRLISTIKTHWYC
jgi:hypothetical protein